MERKREGTLYDLWTWNAGRHRWTIALLCLVGAIAGFVGDRGRYGLWPLIGAVAAFVAWFLISFGLCALDNRHMWRRSRRV